jgi:hypothetical protein
MMPLSAEARGPRRWAWRWAWLLLAASGLAGAAQSRHVLILQTSPLAGFQHYAGRALFPLMGVGDRLRLYREPANPHDDKAVRVEWHGAQIGYAPRADNVDLARLMDRGTAVEARILHLQNSRDPWKRVVMEIYVQESASP